MPNIFSCNTEWFERLKEDQPKVVIAAWKEGNDRLNEWLEKLQKLEDEGVAVFVVDGDSCPSIIEKIGTKEDGETIVFENGVEKGRLTPSEDLEAELEKVKAYFSVLSRGGQTVSQLVS